MGNLYSCIEKRKNDKIKKKKCPYCNFYLSSKKEKNKHVKNCIYNKEIEIENSELSIYSDDPFKL